MSKSHPRWRLAKKILTWLFFIAVAVLLVVYAQKVDWEEVWKVIRNYNRMVLLGAVGVPVLANFSGGIDKFVGPTGGFLISFPIMAYIIGLGVEHRDAFKGAFPVAVVVGTVVNYIVGVILFVIVAHSTVSVAVSACVLPFIPTAIIKAVLACVLGLNIRKRIPGVKKA